MIELLLVEAPCAQVDGLSARKRRIVAQRQHVVVVAFVGKTHQAFVIFLQLTEFQIGIGPELGNVAGPEDRAGVEVMAQLRLHCLNGRKLILELMGDTFDAGIVIIVQF